MTNPHTQIEAEIAHPAEQGDGVREAADVEGLIAKLDAALDAYWGTHQHFIVTGETLTERRWSEGERSDLADERLFEGLASLSFADVLALRSITETNRVQKTCWVVWAIGPTGVQLVAICTSAATANRYRANAASLYPQHRMHVEEAQLDHLFGASDLRSVAYRAALTEPSMTSEPREAVARPPLDAKRQRVVDGLNRLGGVLGFGTMCSVVMEAVQIIEDDALALLPQTPAAPTIADLEARAGAALRVRRLQDVARLVLTACEMADVEEELHHYIDGSYLDRLREVLPPIDEEDHAALRRSIAVGGPVKTSPAPPPVDSSLRDGTEAAADEAIVLGRWLDTRPGMGGQRERLNRIGWLLKLLGIAWKQQRDMLAAAPPPPRKWEDVDVERMARAHWVVGGSGFSDETKARLWDEGKIPGFKARGIAAMLAALSAIGAPSEGGGWAAECDWPAGGRFAFHDDPGEHDPCYVVMPGGAMIPLNHHAGVGVDVARAHFIVDACNAALAQPSSILRRALQYGYALYGPPHDGPWPVERRREFDRLAEAALFPSPRSGEDESARAD